MTTRLFLFNDDFFELDPSSDPRLDPTFPLTQEQYEVLTTEGLMQLLKEEYRNNPQLVQTNARMLRALCALLNQVGRINCVRMQWNEQDNSSQYGVATDDTLARLRALQAAGQLRDADADEMIWSKMPAA